MLILLLVSGCSLIGMDSEDDISDDEPVSEDRTQREQIVINDIDGFNYSFVYHDETFYARYYENNWRIYDSYRITDSEDIYAIVEALTQIHPIPSKDRQSYRSVQNMTDEWVLHNLAFHLLKDDSPYKESARNVDLDPDDEDLSLQELLDEN